MNERTKKIIKITLKVLFFVLVSVSIFLVEVVLSAFTSAIHSKSKKKGDDG